MTWLRTNHFYDQVARRLRGYTTERLAELRPVVAPPNPEDLFTSLVVEQLRADDIVVDIGTGDGVWLAKNVAPHVQAAIGLDYAGARLQTGLETRRGENLSNLEFVLADARSLPISDKSVSVLVNRRGPFGDTSDPRFLTEGVRILVDGARVLEIGIGERNAREVSEVFGRGQMLEAERRGREIDRKVTSRRQHGIEVKHMRDIATFEYFPNREALELRLLTTPTLDDFDPDAEAHLLDEVVRRCTTAHGIRLTFHRTIFIGERV